MTKKSPTAVAKKQEKLLSSLKELNQTVSMMSEMIILLKNKADRLAGSSDTQVTTLHEDARKDASDANDQSPASTVH